MLGIFNREGRWVSPSGRECVGCGSIQDKVMCKACNRSRVNSASIEAKMLRRAKERAKKKGIGFTITIEDIVIPSHCPVFGFPLISHDESGSWNDSPSLDRIDNSQGYVKGNIQVLSALANRMKANATEEQLIKFAKWITNQ